MNYKLVCTFGSGSCVSSFGSSPKVETAAVSSFGLTQKWKLWTRFQFWAVSTFGPAQRSFMEKIKALLGTVLGRRHMKGSMVGKQGRVYIESRALNMHKG